jgi:hypothetical protein
MKILVIIIFFILFSSSASYAWDNKRTHPTISVFTANLFFGKEYLDEDVNGKLVRDLISDGSTLEDLGSRPLNHFHNPTKASLVQAGLNDILTGESALLWTQDGATQVTKSGNDWSWQAVRDYWYNNLTATADAATNDNLSSLLKGLGYQMHMIQDMSQPNHVRNNAHPADGEGLYNGLETWAKKHDDTIQFILNQTTIPTVSVDLKSQYIADITLAPVANLFDTRSSITTNIPSASLAQGLSEYTNANFFSQNTIFAAERFSSDPNNKYFFSYPHKSETDLQKFINNDLPNLPVIDRDKTYQNFRISKNTTTGQTLSCLTKPGFNTKSYFKMLGEGKFFYNSFVIDEECYLEYAQKLIPRAVGYSKAILDYFFRGEIKLTLPSAGVYSAAPFGKLFTELRVNAKNVTATGEEMTDGSVELAITYNVALADPFQGIPVDVEPQYRHIVVPEKNGVRYIPKNAPRELVFDLSLTPIPIWATDVEIRVIYKGILGGETYAVASGYNDISEPTPVDAFNNSDYTCINSIWYRFDEPEAIALRNTSDTSPHAISDISFLAAPAGATSLDPGSANNLSAAGPVSAGDMLRLGYILTDYTNSYAFRSTRLGNTYYPFPVTANTQTYPGFAFRNEGATQSPMFAFRGKKMWGSNGVIFINSEYNGTCTWDALKQKLGL